MESSERTSREGRTLLGRLFRMRMPELTFRGRQEAFKWMERSVADFPIVRSARTTLPLRSGSFQRFLDNARDCFFEGVFDLRVPAALAIRAAHHYKERVAVADEICSSRFDLLGYRGLHFGDPPDWRFDPISGRRSTLAHWTRLDPLDYARVGDCKVVWELNRHQWLVHLGQAYRFTREERYAEALVRSLRGWLDANPLGMGINWTSSLEAGLRLMAWCWAVLLIRDSPALDPSLAGVLRESVRSHAGHIERYLSYYFSPNTHLTGEALALFYAGIVFPELKRADRWRSLARRILVEEIERQVLPDGVYFERSTWYQRYTVDTYLHFLILGSRAGVEIPGVVSERVRAMLDFLVAVRQPDGSMPAIGDADGGWLLPLSRTKPEDFQPVFSTAAVLFNEPAYAWAAGALAPETLWLLGSSAMETFDTLQPLSPPLDTCRVFNDGGFAVMRSGWDRDSHSLIFDSGPLGCPFSGGHGHADLLSIQCSVFGRPHLVDAGTCCYTANSELRDFFRGTAAHSTVMVDGKGQAEPAGPFAWQTRPTGKLLGWTSNQMLAFADAQHDGYQSLRDPVAHRRRVIFRKPRYWVVVDDLSGTEKHLIEIRFQFAPMEVRADQLGWARATLDGRQGLLLRAFATVPLRTEVREGRPVPLEGWVSPNYGQAEPAPVLVYTLSTELPVRVVTLLWPSERVHEETPRVDFICDHRRRVCGLVLPDLAETVTFDDAEPVLERAATASNSPI